MRLVQPFDDGKRLRQGLAVDHQRRHERERVQRAIAVRMLLATVAHQVHGHGVEGQALQRERNPHPIGGR